LPFSSSAKACVCRPAFETYSARVPAALELGDFPLEGALAAAQLAGGPAAAEQVRSLGAGQVHCVAEDDSSLDAADSAPDDLRADCSAAPSTGIRCAAAAPKDDSCPVDCRLAADCLVPVDSAAQKVIGHCALAAQTDGYPADCSETAGSVRAGSVAVDWVQVCCSADLAQADCWVAQTADDHSVPAVQMDDWFRAADDSPADLAVDGYRVDSAPDDCSPAEDCRAVADSPQDYSCLDAHSPVDSQDDSLLAVMAPVLRAER